MQSFRGGIRSKIVHFKLATRLCSFETNDGVVAVANLCGKSFDSSIRKFTSRSSLPLQSKFGSQAEFFTPSGSLLDRSSRSGLFQWTAAMPTFPSRCITTTVNPSSASQDSSAAPVSDLAPRIKFKRLDKTSKHIMQACFILSTVGINSNTFQVFH
ncbi:hypothetical protein CK203_072627 [Vitis vinifera]|uniref:Uncharacterized protein n=1 Tax=Vitis vinifera TaxID=29760 RepID=A0A438EZF3_VITVI|nr:hypothetical protein CK203_072627 [Vitis vinifera]